MAFKAHIATPRVISQSKRFYISGNAYKFTKNKIHLDEPSVAFYHHETLIHNQSKYILIELEKDSKCYTKNSQFQAKFEDGITVNLVTNLWQRFRIRWTHKLTWWQQEKSWIVKTLIVTALGVLTAYYLSYRVGYHDGLKKGLETLKSTDTSHTTQ